MIPLYHQKSLVNQTSLFLAPKQSQAQFNTTSILQTPPLDVFATASRYRKLPKHSSGISLGTGSRPRQAGAFDHATIDGYPHHPTFFSISCHTSQVFLLLNLYSSIMTITGLTSEQLSFWEENGYLIIPDAISQEVVKELVDETAKLLNGWL